MLICMVTQDASNRTVLVAAKDESTSGQLASVIKHGIDGVMDEKFEK